EPVRAFLIRAQKECPAEEPEGLSLPCEVLNLSRDLSGILLRVDKAAVVAGRDNVWLQIPAPGQEPVLSRPGECWLLLPYADEGRNGWETVLTAQFGYARHQDCPPSPRVAIGGTLKVVSDEAAARACCRHLAAHHDFDFHPRS